MERNQKKLEDKDKRKKRMGKRKVEMDQEKNVEEERVYKKKVNRKKRLRKRKNVEGEEEIVQEGKEIKITGDKQVQKDEGNRNCVSESG